MHTVTCRVPGWQMQLVTLCFASVVGAWFNWCCVGRAVHLSSTDIAVGGVVLDDVPCSIPFDSLVPAGFLGVTPLCVLCFRVLLCFRVCLFAPGAFECR